jgi:hypothetical protein
MGSKLKKKLTEKLVQKTRNCKGYRSDTLAWMNKRPRDSMTH